MMKVILPSKFALLALTGALFALPAIRAQSLTFNVDFNTAGLSSDQSNSPFYLDFAMTYGNSSLTASSATISNFSFTGGTALGSGITSGTASGDFGGSVTLGVNSTTTSSEFYQQFSSTVSDIKFQVTVNEPGPNPQGTPSEFTVAVLDSSLGSPAQIVTTAPDTLNLVTLNLNAANTLSNVNFYNGVASADGNTALSLSAVPEPSTYAAIMGGASLLFAAGFRRFKKQALV